MRGDAYGHTGVNLERNLQIAAEVQEIAKEVGATPAQIDIVADYALTELATERFIAD